MFSSTGRVLMKFICTHAAIPGLKNKNQTKSVYAQQTTKVICFPSYITFGSVMDSTNDAKLWSCESLCEIQLNGKTFLKAHILNLRLTPFDYSKKCTTKSIKKIDRIMMDTNYLNVFIKVFNPLNACSSFICNKYLFNNYFMNKVNNLKSMNSIYNDLFSMQGVPKKRNRLHISVLYTQN